MRRTPAWRHYRVPDNVIRTRGGGVDNTDENKLLGMWGNLCPAFQRVLAIFSVRAVTLPHSPFFLPPASSSSFLREL